MVPTTGTVSSVHHDILQNHILTRLDGPTLATVACASTEFHGLSNEVKLWQKICTLTWPSINHPLISCVISTFPAGHRSFFSDSFPLLHHHHHHSSQNLETTELISAVDIYYRNIPIFSKVEETETVSGWFMSTPFRVDLIEPNKEFTPTRIHQVGGEKESWLKQIEKDLTLSWILIDPNQKRAMNLSSQIAVLVERHWLTEEVQVKFAIIMAGEEEVGTEKEYVQCEVVVTCGGKEGEVQVREVSMVMNDMEGKTLTGKESLRILQEAMEKGERRKLGKDGREGKERFKEFAEWKRERREKKEKKERILDWICIASGVSTFMAFWSYIIFR